MSFSYDRYDRRQSPSRRSTLGYWVPLIFTVTVATAGAVAWVWSERRDDEESSDDENLSYGEDRDRDVKPTGSRDNVSTGVVHEDDSLMGRVHGVMRRTPSPQQLYDTVSKRAVAGVAAAGAAVGGVLASIREEDKDAFNDHDRWTEEAAIRRSVEAQAAQSSGAVDTHSKSFAASARDGPSYASSGRRKTVAIVVSAEALADSAYDDKDSYRSETATLLSHIPALSPQSTNLVVLIYTPSPSSPTHTTPPSITSSYSAISTPAVTPSQSHLTEIDPISIHSSASTSQSLHRTLLSQANSLTAPESILPFSTPTGFIPMLRHLAPSLVYLPDSLTGNGDRVHELQRWLSQIVIVVGSEGDVSGLVDTDDEGAGKTSEHAPASKWWESSSLVGLGKGVEIVDVQRLHDDFMRRTQG
ncbi:hypothetical protein EJ04DRAFT_548156 [Polyplosphaeria fusca]|uniref:Uncharacterized protein n=1 Tax=Polyplosphaeria fusca TaxID=682080 RepID=A0A9P4R9J8_9PLEO|nr:hypothetical protein EJ04DRAFT_548156 [Polyplosphaeria fusca]